MARVCSTCGGKPEPSSTQCLACQLEGRTKTQTREAVGQAIMARLAEICWSQKDLAQAVGVNKGTVNKWVLGSQAPSLEMYPRLAVALEWSEDEAAHWLPRPRRLPRRQLPVCDCLCHAEREATG